MSVFECNNAVCRFEDRAVLHQVLDVIDGIGCPDDEEASDTYYDDMHPDEEQERSDLMAQLVVAIIHLDPKLSEISNKDGILPLHRVLSWSLTWNNNPRLPYDPLVKCVAEANPNALSVKYSTNGAYPLHRAAAEKDTDETTLNFLELYPEAASFKDKDGNGQLPLEVLLQRFLGSPSRELLDRLHTSGNSTRSP